MPHYSRRDFLKTAAAGAAVAGLPALRPIERTRSADSLGIALVGLGYYSTDLLAPALQETTNVHLAGIVTGTPAKAKAWQEKYAIPQRNIYSYETFDKIADNPDIDIIYVVLPNVMHREYVVRAARAGKHVICEKPMAITEAECATMIEACDRAGVTLSIGYRMQYEPTTQHVMRNAREKTHGAVQFVTAGSGYREGRPDNWKVKKAMGGGAMMDMGVYSLQACRYAAGEEPVSVSAQTFTTRPQIFKDVDEITAFQLQFPSGAVANAHTSFANSMNHLEVRYERGWLKLDPFQAYGGIKGSTHEGPLNYPQRNQQATQMDEVADCIVNKKPMRVPGEEGMRDMRIVEAIYRSIAAGGTRIKLG
ncbi:MAG: Gfo/Idh/MocA family oxidoreductase [Rhodothermales bacterium]